MSSPPHSALFWKEIGLTTLTTSDYSHNSPCEEIKHTSFSMLPCQHTAHRGLLSMRKFAQPRCSFSLDFCFVNTRFAVGDTKWTSYLSPSLSSSYTRSLILPQPGYCTGPKAQHCSAGDAGGWSQRVKQLLSSFCLAPSPTQLHWMAAGSTRCPDTSAFTVSPTETGGVLCCLGVLLRKHHRNKVLRHLFCCFSAQCVSSSVIRLLCSW